MNDGGRDMRRELTFEPGRPDALTGRAVDALEAGDPAGAERWALRALAVIPDNILALTVLLRCFRAGSDAGGRMRRARQILALAPEADSSLYAILSSLMVLAAMGALSGSELDDYYRWVTRSDRVHGPRHHSAVAIISRFRDRVSQRVFNEACHLVGAHESAALRDGTTGPGGFGYLVTDDLSRIGDMAALLDYMHKLFRLGRVPERDIYMLGRRERMANPAVLDLWRNSVKTVGAEALARAQPKLRRFNPDFLPYGRRYYLKTFTFCLLQREWERKGRRGLLERTGSPAGTGAYLRLLKSRGWRPTDKVVCFHLREPAYDRQSPNLVTQRFRNSRPEKFVPALRHLMAAGFKIIRIGATGAHGYDLGEGFFDYANSAIKAPELDVEILRHSRFYFGSESGPLSVAIAFDKPCCTIDHAQMSWGAMPCRAVLSPKLMWSDRKNRAMTLAETLGPPLHYAATQNVFDDHGIQPIENSAEEVVMVLREFLRRLAKDDFFDTSSYGILQRRAIKTFKRHKIVSNGLLCEEFMQRYDYLF